MNTRCAPAPPRKSLLLYPAPARQTGVPAAALPSPLACSARARPTLAASAFLHSALERPSCLCPDLCCCVRSSTFCARMQLLLVYAARPAGVPASALVCSACCGWRPTSWCVPAELPQLRTRTRTMVQRRVPPSPCLWHVCVRDLQGFFPYPSVLSHIPRLGLF